MQSEVNSFLLLIVLYLIFPSSRLFEDCDLARLPDMVQEREAFYPKQQTYPFYYCNMFSNFMCKEKMYCDYVYFADCKSGSVYDLYKEIN